MNNLLKKCIVELQQETPRLDYVRGILETLVDMNQPLATTGLFGPVGQLVPPTIATFASAVAGIPAPSGSLDEIKRMAGETL